MDVYYSMKRLFGCGIIFCLIALVCAACGSSSTTTAAPSSPTAVASACPTRTNTNSNRPVTGTIQSVDGQTLHLKKLDGTTADVTYTSKTRIMRESLATTAVLQNGTPVTVAVVQNADKSYTATLITLVNRGNLGANQGNTNQGQRRNNPCFANGANGANANGSTRGQNGKANGNAARALRGTVGQLTGNTLTITDAKGDDYTVTLTADTKIVQTTTATADALQPNTLVTIIGSGKKQDVLQAQTILILLAGSMNPASNPAS